MGRLIPDSVLFGNYLPPSAFVFSFLIVLQILLKFHLKKGRKTDPSLINIVRHVTERIDADGNFQIKVFSQRQIDQGEEVTITYINLLRSTMERNAKLEYAWHFRCQCLRCQDPHELGTNIGKEI